MSLRNHAEVMGGLAIIVTMALFIASFLSTVLFMDFVRSADREVYVEPSFSVCTGLAILLLLAFLGYGMVVYRGVLGRARTDRARRAAYFQLLFPLALVGFLVATTLTSFAPSLTFGFPLFYAGTLLYPYTTFVLHREVKAMEIENLLLVRCFRCTYMFEMHKRQPSLLCPYCGQENLNPDQAVGAEVVSEPRA